MRSIPAALSWELFRRGKWNLLGAFLTGNALTFVLLTVMRREGIDLEDRSMIPMHVTMLLINAMLFGAILLSAMGNPYRLRTFPAFAMRRKRSPSSIIRTLCRSTKWANRRASFISA